MMPPMLAALRQPLTPRQLALATFGLAAAVALYCLGYTRLAGRSDTVIGASVWALVNIAPWVPAFEYAKRARSSTGAMSALALGFAASLVLGLMFNGSGDIAFEAWRRLPALAAVAATAFALRWSGSHSKQSAAADPLPLLPRQIDWVQAAGNYVELRAAGRTIVHRSSISAAERDLAAHGFIRIHRSTLVRRDQIARVRPADVLLHDGTSLPVGKRFRAQLSA